MMLTGNVNMIDLSAQQKKANFVNPYVFEPKSNPPNFKKKSESIDLSKKKANVSVA